VPDFSLVDQQGRTRTLQSVMGPKGAMIVFYRSADWCPYCKTQLLELQSQYDTLRQGRSRTGRDQLRLAGNSSRRSAGSTASRSRCCLMSAPRTIKRYGILNTVAEEGLGPNGNDP
jgi:hypothetical protein